MRELALYLVTLTFDGMPARNAWNDPVVYEVWSTSAKSARAKARKLAVEDGVIALRKSRAVFLAKETR